MGYLRGSQEKRKSKNGDTATQNHVDRVRVQDATYEFGGPGRGSGWRQRSLSNIDLTSQSRHSFTKQIRDYSSGLYDLYSRIESRKDYQSADNGTYAGAGGGVSGATASGSGSGPAGDKRKRHEDKGESIYDHIAPSIDPGVLGADACSLRRTRSLAVIREETYNDLQISGVRTRRSQLIPRAKLCNSSFFKNRSKQKYREEDSGSGVDTQTSETRESDDYYANLKKLESEKTQTTPVWTTDKSDLDSLDSDYFKNSLHQPTVSNIFVNSTTTTKNSSCAPEPTAPNNSTSANSKQKHIDTKYQILEIEVHNQNIRHSLSTTTETSVTHSEQTSETYSSSRNNETSTTSTFEEVTLRSDDKEHQPNQQQNGSDSPENACELNINYNTLTLTHHHLQCESNESTYEKKLKFKEDRKSVVSYDSIYLSSEDSNEHTLVNEIIEDPLPEIIISSEGEFVDVSLLQEEVDIEDERNDLKHINIDSLYSQINKSRPKVVSLEPKNNLTSFSDTSTRGTLERLTFISSSSSHNQQQQPIAYQQKESQSVEGKLFSTEPYVGTLIDNQYCSLPDVNIGISLRASERIDAKLRQSCVKKASAPVDDQNVAPGVKQGAASNPIYDSISRFGRAHKRLRQRENFDVIHQKHHKQPSITVDELPKEAPTIEVAPPSKAKGPTSVVVVSQPPSYPPPPPPPPPLPTTAAPYLATLTRSPAKTTTTLTIAPKVKKALPSTISLGKKQVVVDELAAKVNQAIKKQNELKQFKHVSKTEFKLITSAEKITPSKIPAKITQPQPKIPALITTAVIPQIHSNNSKIPKPPPIPTSAPPPLNTTAVPTSILKKVPLKPKRSLTDLTHETLQFYRANAEHQPHPKNIETTTSKQTEPAPEQQLSISNKIAVFKAKKQSNAVLDAKEALRNEFKANLTDTLRRRIAQSRELFNARPIRIASVDNISKLNDTYEISPQLKYKVQFKEQANVSDNMSRPQILNVVDATKRVCSVAPRQNNGCIDVSAPVPPPQPAQAPQSGDIQTPTSSTVRTETSRPDNASQPRAHAITSEVRQEFQEKVDSVRCYWSKLVEAKQQQQKNAGGVDEVDNVAIAVAVSTIPSPVVERNFVAAGEKSIDTQHSRSTYNGAPDRAPLLRDHSNDGCSFSPFVEIFELDGQKQAAVVNAQHFEVQNFDHVRYKVMKSDTFQKNIRTNSRKEAQFDGLLQYLQDYSFQELLANNNVVIIEPIRTKIEKISDRSVDSQTFANCKITSGSGPKQVTNEQTKNGIKRHFFYHPIRVNKELLDEELPTPDTVKNARKVFEESLRLRAAGGGSIGFSKDDNFGNHAGASKTNESLRKKAMRHLSIDTTFNSGGSSGGGSDDAKVSGIERKWDSSSLSSGISSGELSSPCECNDHVEQKDMFSSEENICDDELCESYYVSQDVLAKIRECGSSVTYYGGRVVDNKSPEVSPMTKAIMQEIRGNNSVCGACQPRNCPHSSQVFPKSSCIDDSMGLKFKLVKSNSCSSRLELAGTGLDEEQLRHTQTIMEDIHNRSASPAQDAEESVRTLVSRLEFGQMHPKTSKPRIIESRCIEKHSEPARNAQQQEQSPLMLTTATSATAYNTSDTSAEELARLKPVADLIAQVTINSHIASFASPALVASVKPKSKDSITTSTSNANTVPTKLGRNRNVDLAIGMSAGNAIKEQLISKGSGHTRTDNSVADMERKPHLTATGAVVNTQQQVNAKNAKNIINHERGDVTSATMAAQVGMDTNKSNGSNAVMTTSTSQDAHVNGRDNNAVADVEGLVGGGGPLRLVKWNTLSKFDEKNYVTNDAKLKLKPKYDEIEFEEFEVFDPNNPQNNNECYDSLNDK